MPLRALVLLMMTGTAASAQNQLQASALSPSEEHLLLTRLLVYLHRDTFPPSADRSSEETRQSSGQMKTFIESRRKLLSNIRIRLIQIKAADELKALFDSYQAQLEFADKHATIVRGYESDYFRGLKVIRDRTLRLYNYDRLVQSDDLKNKPGAFADSLGGFASDDPSSNIHGVFGGAMLDSQFLANANETTQKVLAKIVSDTSSNIARYEANNLPTLLDKCRGQDEAFQKELALKRKEWHAVDRKNVEALAKKFEWNDSDRAFDPYASAEQLNSENPFLPLSKLNRIRRVATTKEAEDLTATATSLLAMVDKMPIQKADEPTLVYNRIRADIAYLAGLHANRAAEFILGDAGLRTCVKLPLEAGKTAEKAFEIYESQIIGKEVLQPKPIMIMQKALAHAYAGNSQKAYSLFNTALLPKNVAGIHDPKFFYDGARIRCLNDSDNTNVDRAFAYLHAAFLMGYRNAEKARISNDFNELRKFNPARFEDAIRVSK